MALNSKWFNNFTGSPEQKQQLEQTIRGSNHVLNILTEIIEREIKELETSKATDYDNANWSLWMADRLGQKRALERILLLTKLER